MTSSKNFNGSIVHNDLTSDTYNTYYPYLNTKISTVFESDDTRAFAWNVDNNGSLKEQIAVKVPTDILDNKIVMSSEESLYSGSQVLVDSELIDFPDTFIGKAKCITKVSGEIIYRKLCVSYTISLTNNETNQVKKVSGKYIRLAPVDYNSRVDYENLQ